MLIPSGLAYLQLQHPETSLLCFLIDVQGHSLEYYSWLEEGLALLPSCPEGQLSHDSQVSGRASFT